MALNPKKQVARDLSVCPLALLMLMLAVLYQPLAMGADWFHIYKSSQNESDYFVDQDSVSEDGRFAKAWILENRNGPAPAVPTLPNGSNGSNGSSSPTTAPSSNRSSTRSASPQISLPAKPNQERPTTKSHLEYRSYVSMHVVDCERQNTAIVRGLYFSKQMGKGNILSSFNREIDSQSLSAVEPETLGAAVLAFLCERPEVRRRLQT